MPNESKGLSPSFYTKLLQISSELGLSSEDLLAVMFSESGVNPTATNSKSNAVGLIQFLPSTLKGLGWAGTPEEFKLIDAEQQLDYVKKHVNSIKSFGPILSAEHYYLSVFYPAALKLPGIKQNDKSTVFIEKNPEFVMVGDKKISKKYHNIGINLPIESEIKAYHANPVFHNKSNPDVITLGDMGVIINQSKSNPSFKQLVSHLSSTPSYQSSSVPPTTSPTSADVKFQGLLDNDEVISSSSSKVSPISGDAKFQGLLDEEKMSSMPTNQSASLFSDLNTNFAATANTRSNLKILPNHAILIQVKSANTNESIEFCRVLCATLDEELLSSSFTHTDGVNVEVECNIAGPANICLATVKELTACTINNFKNATKKIGSINVDAKIKLHKKSKFSPISLKMAEINHRKFLLKFA